MERKNVLIVEDEPQIIEVLESYLRREGLEVVSRGDVAGALSAIEAHRPDMLILDVTLPDGSGLDVLRAVSSAGARIPTIVLTSRGEEADRIVGLELGADDYVTKPFSPREVVARVRALFRRTHESQRAEPAHGKRRISIGDLEIDLDFHQVSVEGTPAELTATEFKILGILAQNRGEVFTRAHLLDLLDDGSTIFERTLDRHINNLRKKIEPDPSNPSYVLTVYGVGYKMRHQ